MTFLRLKGKLISLACATLVASLPVAAQSPSDIGELFASQTTAHGPALLAGMGMGVASGSQVAAGKSTATLRLARGGEVRICPNSSLTVSAVNSNVANQKRELLLSVDTGSVEFDYPLNDLADTLVTPDFKFILAGPGVFHFSFGVSDRGDTCIKPMRGNNASLVVSEMLGNGVYRIKPNESVMFTGGKISGLEPLQASCGCPSALPTEQAESEPPKPEPPKPAEETKVAEAPTPVAIPHIPSHATEPLPPERPDAVHVQVEAPLVYRGDQPQPAYAIARIRFSTLPNVLLTQETGAPVVLKPGRERESAKSQEKKGFFGRIKGFFSSVFH